MTELATTDRPILATEYAVAATGLWSRQAWRSLPHTIDDITQDFGEDLYERVDLDPTAHAGKNVLKSGVIEDGIRLESAVSDEAADGYALAQEIRAFCESVLGDLQIPIDDVLWDLCDAFIYGSRMAEQIYTDTPATAYALPGSSPISRTQHLLTLAALKPKPRTSVAFVVDAFMNVQAIQAQLPGTGWNGMSTVDARSARAWPGMLPRAKFAILSFRPKDSDPRGVSLYRPAYWPWFAKQEVWQEFLKYLANFASPSVYAVASEAASKSGVEVVNADGSKSKIPATQVLLSTLMAFRNNSAAAFDYGTILKALEVSNDGTPFHTAFTRCDEQITVAILNQMRATMEAKHGSRADSETGQDILDTVIRQIKRSVCTMIKRDVLTPLVEYNYGPGAARMLTPMPSLGDVEQHDFATDATAIAALARSRYISPSQYAGIDKRLGLPARTDLPDPTPAVDPAADPKKEGSADESV